MHSPFFADQVLAEIDHQFFRASTEEQAHLYVVRSFIDGDAFPRERVFSAYRSLNRYQIQPGKTFASNAKDKNRTKVLRLVANDVVIQNVKTQKVETVSIDQCLKRFEEQKYKEVTLVDDLIETVKSVLGPALGVFLTGALISWLAEKLSG